MVKHQLAVEASGLEPFKEVVLGVSADGAARLEEPFLADLEGGV